ncbi:MAG: hypothetical protein DDT19_00011 [Syntrophomonadaceae bacterium]|nr:hypothetical protein [Bacillota bacterium]
MKSFVVVLMAMTFALFAFAGDAYASWRGQADGRVRDAGTVIANIGDAYAIWPTERGQGEGWRGGRGEADGRVRDAGTVIANIVNRFIPAFQGLIFLIGLALTVWGGIAFANKENNPQAAQTASKKLVIGILFILFGIVVSIAKATLQTPAPSPFL